MDINDMNTFIKTINQHKADLYIGSRFLKESKTENMKKTRKIILWISKLVTRIFYSAQVSDPHV
jgi:hypothetical protein